jgi:ribonuclease HII
VTKLSIREIEKYLQESPELTREIYDALLSDRRQGVQGLLAKADKKRREQQQEKERMKKMLLLEELYWGKGFIHIAGVDEAGRGPLAGPVVAAAVILPREAGEFLKGVDDSKKLSFKKREELYPLIRAHSLAVGVGIVAALEIDELNIYQAGLKAFSLAVKSLKTPPDFVLSDAYRVPGLSCPQLPVVRGDSLSLSIAAASIVAKVTRDRIMDDLDREFPQYGFGQNKGYPTREHREALKQHGPCPWHRRSFDLLGLAE